MENACASDTRLLCVRDAELLALLKSASVRNVAKITQRRQRVRDCLVDHAEDLSPPCVHALIGNLATSASVLPLDAGGDGATNRTEAIDSPSHKASGDAAAAHQPMESRSSPMQPQAQVTTDESGIEVRIFLINHPAPVTATQASTPYIRIGGDSAQYTDGDHASGSATAGLLVSPWLWLAVLPFICIGVYVSVVETIAFVRRRRDAVYRIGAAQYMPIPSSSGSSKV